MRTTPITPTPSTFAIARYAKGLRLGRAFAEAQWPDQPHVGTALEMLMGRKAAIPGLSSTNAPNLAALGVYDAATAQLLAADSAVEAARPRMREVPFAITTPRESDSGTGGGWVAPGSALPVVKGFLEPLILKPSLIGSVVVLTDELLRARGSDAVVRNMILAAQGRVETTKFLDPSIGATADSPASITNGATSVPWTGVVATDLINLLDAIATSGKGLALMARPATLAFLALGIGVPLSSLGVTILPTPNAPRRLVVAADLAEIAIASTPIAIDMSDEATLEMTDAPTNSVDSGSPLAPVPTSTVSLFQSDATAFKVSRFLNWSVRDGAVSYLSGVGSPA